MTTHVTLKADIALWLHNTALTAVIPSFVTLAEAMIRRDVRVREMQTAADLTITDGTATIPTGFLEARRLILDNATSWALSYEPPDVFHSSKEFRDTGPIKKYTIESTNMLFRPSTSETGKLVYYKAFDALSADGDTNYVLTNAYDVYLYGALMHAGVYIRDDAQIGRYATAYSSAIGQLNHTEQMSSMTTKMTDSRGMPGP